MLALGFVVASTLAQPAPTPTALPPIDWKTEEAPLLADHVQITAREKFIKAGEAYFDHQTPPRWIIFQAVPVPAAGVEPDPFYSMYVAKLKRDGPKDDGRVVGVEEPIRISPVGSANTCGWFHPREPWRVLFGSTLERPKADQKSGFQVGTRKYVWMFPAEMEVVNRRVREVYEDRRADQRKMAVCTGFDVWDAALGVPTPILSRPAYDAECSWSPDGRFVLYASVREAKEDERPDRPDADIHVLDTKTGEHHPLVTADGYDGGPFFSPDGTRICYRSDRRGDDRLQLFVADLKFDGEGVPIGIEREHQLTDDSNVNWAPYWHPSGKYLLFGTSTMGHANYEVFAVQVPPAGATVPAKDLRTRRVTSADGADVLPAFSADGGLLMWTAQRGEPAPGEPKPSSQVWIATVRPGARGLADPVGLFEQDKQTPELSD